MIHIILFFLRLAMAGGRVVLNFICQYVRNIRDLNNFQTTHLKCLDNNYNYTTPRSLMTFKINERTGRSLKFN